MLVVHVAQIQRDHGVFVFNKSAKAFFGLNCGLPKPRAMQGRSALWPKQWPAKAFSDYRFFHGQRSTQTVFASYERCGDGTFGENIANETCAVNVDA